MIPKYLYVKNWEYADPILLEVFKGLPKIGQVYKAEFNPSTNQYFLQFKESGIQILLPNLISNNMEQDGYNCELVELSKTNILDLNLDESELDKIISWNQTMPQQNIQAVIQHGFEQMQQERAERIAVANEALCNLDNVNSAQFEILVELAGVLEEESILKHDSITDLSLDPNYGAGINISRAQECLQMYVSSDRRINENPADLYEALNHIITELERRSINDLDE